MSAPILIVGQGLAGSLLGWEFERAGFDFEIVDAGHAGTASRVGAGIINPITGQRIVKSWRVDEWLPFARETYRELKAALGVALVEPMRVRRFFRDEREQRVFREKSARGELAPYAGEADAAGFWIEGALRVDTAALIAALRRRWRAAGRLKEVRFDVGENSLRRDLVVLCTGTAWTESPRFRALPLERAKGEILTVETERVEPRVILNRGHWALPIGGARLKIGATFRYDFSDDQPTSEAREELARSAQALLDRPFSVVGHDAALRVTSPDRHPVVGRSPQAEGWGVFNGLGSKGALLAPALARQWVNHLTEGVPFDPEVDVARLSR